VISNHTFRENIHLLTRYYSERISTRTEGLRDDASTHMDTKVTNLLFLTEK